MSLRTLEDLRGGETLGRALNGYDYAVVFADIEQDLNAFANGFRRETSARIMGCSSYGTLCSEGDGAAVAYGIKSDDLVMGLASASIGKNPVKSGADLAEKAIEDIGKDGGKLSRIFARYSAIVSNRPEKIVVTKPYYHMLLFTDPFMNCDEEVTRGINSRVQRQSPLFGGSAYGKGGECTLFCDGQAFGRGAAMALIATTRDIGYACESGLVLRSRKPYIVTRARGRVVYEINGERAIDVYSEITGISTEDLINEKWLAFDTAVECPFVVFDNCGKLWAKSPFTANEDGSITFMTGMAVGNILFAAKSTQSGVVRSAEKAVKEALEQVIDPEVLLVFDCQQRKSRLGENLRKEQEAVKRASKGTPFMGFYTMGEHLSVADVSLEHLNGTVIVAAIGKR